MKMKRKRKRKRKINLLCLKEDINVERLEWILNNISSCVIKEEQTKFKSYAEKMLTGSVTQRGSLMVKYHPVAHGKGRVYANGAMSLQGFSKKIRNDLARGIYHDIDMVNCHPVFLSQICVKHDIADTPCLDYYLQHRETVLLSIMKSSGCLRGEAKMLMLMLMYGGKIKTWLKKIGKPTADVPPFVKNYAKELTNIASSIVKHYPEFTTSHRSNPLFSKLSLLLQDVENRALMAMSKFFFANGYPPGIYLYDGLMIYRKERHSTEPLNVRLLKGCKKYVKKVTGFSVTLEEKPIGEGY